MNGAGELVLYLDFDGVLHHENVRWSPKTGPYLDAPPRYSLFQHSRLLEQILSHYLDVRIVLSTAWCHRYRLEFSAARLTPCLRARVVGTIYDMGLTYPDDLACIPKGRQIAGDAVNRKPRDWLALDDNDDCWPQEHLQQLVKTHMYEGIRPPGVRLRLEQKLKEMCK